MGKIRVYYCAYCGVPSDRGFIQRCRACSAVRQEHESNRDEKPRSDRKPKG